MEIKQITITMLTAVLLVSIAQSHAFFDDVFGNSDKPKHKSNKKSELPVHVGMTMEQVREKLGDPDSEDEESDGRVQWIYHADSVASRLQDDAVDSACMQATSCIPFVGSTMSSASMKATKPIHAKRTGYIIQFNGGKVTSYTKMKAQG